MAEDSVLDLEKLARQIATAMYNASSSVLVGNAPQCVHDLSARFRDIQPGDLVVERTTCLMAGRPALDAVGYFLRSAEEPFNISYPEFEWDEKVEGKPMPKETVYYIRTLDGREFRWHNADFMSAPTEWPMRGAKRH